MPKHPIARDVAVVVAAKLALALAAALFVFSPDKRPRIDKGSVETRLIGTSNVNAHSRNIAP
jgi:hypothetical protein